MFTLNTQQKNIINQIAKKHELRLVLLFGSYATGKTHPESDIDIAIKITKKTDLNQYTDILRDFQKMLSTEKVDLSFINHADPLFLFHICKTAELLYGQNREFNELKMYAFKLFIEHKPYFDMEKKYVNKSIRSFAYGR